jgi:hypothetical protein
VGEKWLASFRIDDLPEDLLSDRTLRLLVGSLKAGHGESDERLRSTIQSTIRDVRERRKALEDVAKEKGKTDRREGKEET